MPLDHQKAREQWVRYIYSRDMGHREYIAKANRCEDFFTGLQWDPETVNELRASKRPALTINKILITLASIFGEQIDTRSEIAFRPRFSAPPQNADILTKTVRFIGDQNQLNWVRSEVFADGCVTSRAYYDVRLRFDRNTAGECWISRVNPRSVLPDPDASDYDPACWNDVIVTSWVTPDDIELIYKDKEAADTLRQRGESAWTLGFDSMDISADRFAGRTMAYADVTDSMKATMRSVRLIDRQHRVLTKMKYFVDPKTGDKMKVPDGWDRNQIAMAVQSAGLVVSDELCKRVRWTVTAEDYVLHDSWSPFTRFTIVPYFPHFRYGRTVGLVEGLIDPQELLNKALSQELHIVNTMANSGWIVKAGALVNMDADELEQQGAKTGIVLEVQNDVTKDIVKIQPNSIPSGLDRLSFKAEQYIKTVSGRGDNQLGLTRPDQSGKLAEEANVASDVTLRSALDNLERTDFMLAHSILEIVQNFYTDHRVMNITRDELTGESTQVAINVPDQASGEVLNDLSLGTYDVTIVSQKARRTLEESEFANAVSLKELGIPIPDRFMIENSNLRKKGDIIKAMDAEAQSPDAIEQKQVVQLGRRLEVGKLKADISSQEADAAHKRAKTAESIAKTENESKGDPGKVMEAEAKVEAKKVEMNLDQQAHDQKMQHEREMHAQKMQLERETARTKNRAAMIQAVATAKATEKGLMGPAQKTAKS